MCPSLLFSRILSYWRLNLPYTIPSWFTLLKCQRWCVAWRAHEVIASYALGEKFPITSLWISSFKTRYWLSTSIIDKEDLSMSKQLFECWMKICFRLCLLLGDNCSSTTLRILLHNVVQTPYLGWSSERNLRRFDISSVQKQLLLCCFYTGFHKCPQDSLGFLVVYYLMYLRFKVRQEHTCLLYTSDAADE